MQRTNYQLLLDKTIEDILKSGEKTSLLLHACCAPCSSYVLEYLSSVFNITLFYYNPNISPESEYKFRVREVQRLLDEMELKNSVVFSEGVYEPDKFYEMAKGLELLPEGGERCFKCYRLRLSEAAEYAEKNGFDYFTTTLSISPYKNADKLNEIGGELAREHGVKYLYSDFKKRNGYKRSIELSEKYSLYRQNYCGCVYSYEAMKRKERNGTQ